MTDRVPRDVDEVAEAVGRLIAAISKRGQRGDLEALGALFRLEPALKVATLAAGSNLHYEHGYTWQEVGQACDISRQAAEQRWGGR